MSTEKHPADIGLFRLTPEKWSGMHAWLCGSAVVESDMFWPHEVPRNHSVSDIESRTTRPMNVNTLLVSADQRLTDIELLLNYYSAFLRLTRAVAWFKRAACDFLLTIPAPCCGCVSMEPDVS